MKFKNNILLKDGSIKYSIILCLLFAVAQVVLLAFFYRNLPPYIPLFNSLPWGEERLAFSQLIFLVPVFSIVILLVNLYIAKIIYLKHALIARLIIVNAFLIALLGFIALLQILLLIY